MIQNTKNYDQFKFREDNRQKIDQCHVKRLVESIKSRNLLELRPIIVNNKFEIIDGQHRLLAAKALNVPVYYQQEKKLEAIDIVRMNITKPWKTADYFNFYCHHDYSEYKKLSDFMKKNKLNLNVALTICVGQAHLNFKDFREGNFQFKDDSLDDELEICWETISYIKKMNGFSPYTLSNRFWKSLIKLIRHPNFDNQKWKNNMKKMIDHFSPKARAEDYEKMMQTVYNWRNNSRINLIGDI